MTATFYQTYPKFLLAVDCIIFGFQEGRLKLLLQRRNIEPFKGEWSLMGGFVKENESVDDTAKRVLYELTGMHDVYMQQVGAFGNINRDPGERVISVAYYALINVDKFNQSLCTKHHAYWEDITQIPNLYFDHKEMIIKAHEILKQKVSCEPIGFNLLPTLFTLTQLQALHEAVLGENIDKRNFRKKVKEMSFIEKTSSIDKTTSRRGAYLYRYNDRAYKEEPNFKL